MEDTEMSEQQLPEASQVNLVDADVKQEHPSEDQNSTETRHSPNSLTADDLPTDVDMSDNPALPDKPDNKSSSDAKTKASNAAPAELLEEKSNGDAAPPAELLEEKSNGDAAPLPLAVSSTPKSGRESMEKSKNWLLSPEMGEADEDGTPDERAAFMKELESFYKERSLEFKPPKFYGEPLNCLKLWRAVIRLGGYDAALTSRT
ncbi:hypothetical protein COLO4_03301 [Corchorus olitorius]|uniref:ARID domain-containing protein n=1 Tax=Corchorus olitorius TaxID=93759 RepID=A0A1R3KYY9_9ROSI|nr:hypothetical protein COLO4_03301 [Corchorus olitorius]